MRTITFLFPSLLFLGLFGAVSILPKVHSWEQKNHYPYGKMCDSVFTMYKDTCGKEVATTQK